MLAFCIGSSWACRLVVSIAIDDETDETNKSYHQARDERVTIIIIISHFFLQRRGFSRGAFIHSLMNSLIAMGKWPDRLKESTGVILIALIIIICRQLSPRGYPRRDDFGVYYHVS
jgi:hypothetical protein